MSDTKGPEVQDVEVTPRTRAQAYSACLYDARISRGALHLWYVLQDHLNWKTGVCNPGIRRLQKLLRCHKDSIQKWAEELRAASWLDWDKVENRKPGSPQGVSHQYRILDGLGFEFLKAGSVPKSRDTTVPKTRVTQKWGHSAPKTRDTVSPKVGTELTPCLKDKGGGEILVGKSSEESEVTGSGGASTSALASRAESAPLDFLIYPKKFE